MTSFVFPVDENETNDIFVKTTDFDIVTYGFKYLQHILDDDPEDIEKEDLTPAMFASSTFIKRTDFRTGIVRMFKMLGSPILDKWEPYQHIINFSHIYQDVAVLTDMAVSPSNVGYRLYTDYVLELLIAAEQVDEERKDLILRTPSAGKKQVRTLVNGVVNRLQNRFLRRFMLLKYLDTFTLSDEKYVYGCVLIYSFACCLLMESCGVVGSLSCRAPFILVGMTTKHRYPTHTRTPWTQRQLQQRQRRRLRMVSVMQPR